MTQEIKLLIITFLVAFLLCGAVSATESSSDNSKIEAQLMNVSVPFVENQGQIDPEVSYYANTFYGTSYITIDGITHQINGKDNKTLVVKEQFLDSYGNIIAFNAQGEVPSAAVSYFKGNNPDNWHTQLSTYNFINLGELYPGITVKLCAAGSNIEKLFFLSPGANPDDIRIQIMGADELTMDGEGNLIIKSDRFPDVSMSKPMAFQDKNKNIEAEYQITDNTYQFKIAKYDQTKQLTIDPTLQYSTYLGGTKAETGYDIAVDGEGNAYITGQTHSDNFPTTTGVHQPDYQESFYAFVTKLNPTGTTLIYSTYLGGTGYESGCGIAVDGEGNAYITGYTFSDDFPTTPRANQSIPHGNADAFVTKLNPTGTKLIYSTYLGGTSHDFGRSIAVDGEGNAYITGETNSDDFPTKGAYQATHKGGGYDAFVTKLNPTGTKLTYSTYLGGTDFENGYGIAVDALGHAYITGYTSSVDFPTTPGAYQTTYQGNAKAFVTKLNPTGTTLTYSTYLGGTIYDYGEGIAVDALGHAYITGLTGSDDFPTTPGAYQTTHQGKGDAFVTKLNPTGTTLTYSTYLGGTDSEIGKGIAVDAFGHAYITGRTYSDDFPTTTGANQTTHQGKGDAFVTKLNPTGTTLTYSTYLGGTDYEEGLGIAVDAFGHAYITGYTSSVDFPTTPGANQTTYQSGFSDVFVAKFMTLRSDLYINSWSSKTHPIVGEIYTLTFKLGNRGPNTAENVEFTLPLPDGVEFVDVNVDQGTAAYDPAARTITWTVGDVVVGDPYAWVRVKSLKLGSFTFKPTLTTDTYNPNIENSIQAATVTIKADGEPSSKTVHAKTIGMEKTGQPILPLALAILSILGVITTQREKK